MLTGMKLIRMQRAHAKLALSVAKVAFTIGHASLYLAECCYALQLTCNARARRVIGVDDRPSSAQVH